VIRIGRFGILECNISFYDWIGIEMVIYTVTKFWLFGAGDKVEGTDVGEQKCSSLMSASP